MELIRSESGDEVSTESKDHRLKQEEQRGAGWGSGAKGRILVDGRKDLVQSCSKEPNECGRECSSRPPLAETLSAASVPIASRLCGLSNCGMLAYEARPGSSRHHDLTWQNRLKLAILFASGSVRAMPSASAALLDEASSADVRICLRSS